MLTIVDLDGYLRLAEAVLLRAVKDARAGDTEALGWLSSDFARDVADGAGITKGRYEALLAVIAQKLGQKCADVAA